MSKEEGLAAGCSPEDVDAAFTKIDANQDGLLSKKEMVRGWFSSERI